MHKYTYNSIFELYIQTYIYIYMHTYICIYLLLTLRPFLCSLLCAFLRLYPVFIPLFTHLIIESQRIRIRIRFFARQRNEFVSVGRLIKPRVCVGINDLYDFNVLNFMSLMILVCWI